MARLCFYFFSMNAGKSRSLLQSSYDYRERGMSTLVMAPGLNDRYGAGRITSRIELESPATRFGTADDLFAIVSCRCAEGPLHCVLID